MPRIERLVLVGAGLIGGSFSLALKQAGAVGHVIGVGRTAATLDEARELGVIDEVANGFSCVAGADLVMLAMPVGQTRSVLRALKPHLGGATVVTDAGSTKRDVIAAARAELGTAFSRFIPGHPVAGTEHSGPRAAFASLFLDRRVVLTPVAETEGAGVEMVRNAWLACGAKVFELTPELHDRVLASVSHLPHMLAFALVDQVASEPDAGQFFSFSAGGFRDFTRIASSHPEMWRDICMANREALIEDLAKYEARLGELKAMLNAGDGVALEALFARARDARNRWLVAAAGGGAKTK